MKRGIKLIRRRKSTSILNLSLCRTEMFAFVACRCFPNIIFAAERRERQTVFCFNNNGVRSSQPNEARPKASRGQLLRNSVAKIEEIRCLRGFGGTIEGVS